jgi:hypothetical protein
MYVIVSPQLGKVGSAFEPADSQSIHPLLDGGFIAEQSDTAAPKSAKNNDKTTQE